MPTGRYQCDLTVTLDAPLERVEAVLRDYEKLSRRSTRAFCGPA